MIIVGLGNPGKKYEKTRHNIGFEAINYLIKKFNASDFRLSKKFFGLISKSKDNKIIFLLPQTYMNNSGKSVKTAIQYYKEKPENLIIIHDDIDLIFGNFKISQNRGSAGHKGVQSIIDSLDSKNFTRIRIGILPKNKTKQEIDTKKFVLQKFSIDEQKQLPEIFEKIYQFTISHLFRRYDYDNI